MDIKTYLDRIDFHDPIALDTTVLFKLQRQHLLAIPFENLDIHYGRKISLSINEIYQRDFDTDIQCMYGELGSLK